MTRINLLPWREELRKRQQREFGYMILAGLLVSLTLVGFAHLVIQNKIDFQHQRNDLLRKEIAELEKKITEIKELEKVKASLLARMDVIQQLQTSRPQIVHLFDEIINILPSGAYIEQIKQQGEMVTLQGKAQSNARVSALMRSIDSSQWLKSPTLQKIADSDRSKTGLFSFNLQMHQTTPHADEEASAAKPTATKPPSGKKNSGGKKK